MKWLKKAIDYLKSKEFKELVEEKVTSFLTRQSVKKVADDVVDEIYDEPAESVKRTNTELINLIDTLKLGKELLKDLKESEQVLEMTKKAHEEQSAKRREKHIHSLIDVLSSAPNFLMMSAKYVKEFSGFFDDAENRAKSLKELNREAANTILDVNTNSLEEKLEKARALQKQLEIDLEDVEKNGMTINMGTAEQPYEGGVVRSRENLMIDYEKAMFELFQTELQELAEGAKEEVAKMIPLYRGESAKIDAAYKTTQHRGSFGLNEDAREYGYHTNTHESEIKSIGESYKHFVTFLEKKEEVFDFIIKAQSDYFEITNQQATQAQEKAKTEEELFQEELKRRIELNEETEKISNLEIEFLKAETSAVIDLTKIKEYEAKRDRENAEQRAKQAKDDEAALKKQQEGIKEAGKNIANLGKEVSTPWLSSALDGMGKMMEKFSSKFKKKNEENTESAEQAAQAQGDAFNKIAGEIAEYSEILVSMTGALFSKQNEMLAQEIEAAQEKYEALSAKYDQAVEKRKESDEELQSLEEQAKSARGGRLLYIQGQIDAEMAKNKQLSDQEKKLQADKDKTQKDIEKKQKQQKKNDLKQQMITSVANVATGATMAMAQWGFPLGIINAAILGATGALQVAAIGKQMSKLQDGGLLNGRLHSQGGMRIEGTNIEVEGGEYVVNRDSTRKNMGLIRYINSQRRELDGDDLHSFFSQPSHTPFFASSFAQMMEQGGEVPMMPTQVDISNSDLLGSIQNIKFEPRVAVTDIHAVQGQMAQVDEWVGM